MLLEFGNSSLQNLHGDLGQVSSTALIHQDLAFHFAPITGPSRGHNLSSVLCAESALTPRIPFSSCALQPIPREPGAWCAASGPSAALHRLYLGAAHRRVVLPHLPRSAAMDPVHGSPPASCSTAADRYPRRQWDSCFRVGVHHSDRAIPS